MTVKQAGPPRCACPRGVAGGGVMEGRRGRCAWAPSRSSSSRSLASYERSRAVAKNPAARLLSVPTSLGSAPRTGGTTLLRLLLLLSLFRCVRCTDVYRCVRGRCRRRLVAVDADRSVRCMHCALLSLCWSALRSCTAALLCVARFSQSGPVRCGVRSRSAAEGRQRFQGIEVYPASLEWRVPALYRSAPRRLRRVL